MSNHSIFKKLDDLCTKVTVAIIGDIPHDGQNQETSSTQSQQNTSDQKNVGIKGTLLSVKENLLNLGKPADEKALLYEEVVKKERTHTSEEENIAINSASPKTKIASTKKPSSSTAKKTGAKQGVNTTVGKTDTKKSTAKKSTGKKTTTTKKTATSTKSTTVSSTKKPSAKKPVAKKSSIEKNSTTSKSAKPATAKKAETKSPSKTKSDTKKKTPVKKTTAVKKATNSTTASAKTTTSKKSSTKTAPKKIAPKKKTTSAKTKGGKRDEKIALYAKHIKKYYGEVDKEFLTIVVKNLGPSIYKENAEMISCSDPKELKTVRKNFLVKKLGIDASDGVLNAAIQDVCEELKASRTKYRATFYYALAKKFKKESVLS